MAGPGAEGEPGARPGGTAATPAVSTDDRFTTVTVPTNGAPELVIAYTVRGAVVTVPDGTALQWRVLQGLSLSVTSFRATVLIPGVFTYVSCTAGSPNSTTPCLSAAAGTEDATTLRMARIWSGVRSRPDSPTTTAAVGSIAAA